MMNAKSEGITNISEVEYLNTCTEAVIKAKLKSNKKTTPPRHITGIFLTPPFMYMK